MSKILAILWEWRFVIILVITGALYYIKEWEKAKGIMYAGIAQAKRYAKDQVLKSGKQQEEYVVKLMLQRLPLSLRIFLGEDQIRKIVKWLYNKLGDYIDDGVLNESFKIR
jgi:DNA polymerase III alpha subunit (gram-positive type)